MAMLYYHGKLREYYHGKKQDSADVANTITVKNKPYHDSIYKRCYIKCVKDKIINEKHSTLSFIETAAKGPICGRCRIMARPLCGMVGPLCGTVGPYAARVVDGWPHAA